MPEKEFEFMYGEIKDAVSKYSDPGERIAFIEGWIHGMDSDVLLSVEQVSRIIELRYPENERAPINEAATSGRTKK